MDTRNQNPLDTVHSVDTSDGLAELAAINFDQLDSEEILQTASSAVPRLTPCRVEAAYRCIDGMLAGLPGQPRRPDLESQLPECDTDRSVALTEAPWAWVYVLRGQDSVHGYLVVSSDGPPTRRHRLLLTLLAQKTGAALACAQIRARGAGLARRLDETQGKLHDAQRRLRQRATMHEMFVGALASGAGEHGIATALHQVTGLPVSVEDRFGNLLAWAGPDQPQPYPKPDRTSREQLLKTLAVRNDAMRVKERVAILVRSRAAVLGVLSLVDPELRAQNEQVEALEYASTILAMELSRRRSLAEMELALRRELLDDLLKGTDAADAYARAEALGHDLHGPHYVVLVHYPHVTQTVLAAAVCRAATALRLRFLHGRHGGMVVLLVDERPDPQALHEAISARLGNTGAVIGIGTRCQSPADFPESLAKAHRALNIRLHSATPQGASAYDELGFYRLVDAAQSGGAVEDYVREWLGALLDYDERKNSDFVATLSHYLECGGNYDETAAALHIHRSTLRYRLARIGELTGYDLRDVDTRFNLHAATRAWRFLNPVDRSEATAAMTDGAVGTT
jgi:sugar diacid utilization regulator